MWSELVDDKGRARAGILYKAALYDRDAHISPRRRFRILRDYDKDSPIECYVQCGDAEIHRESVAYSGKKYGDGWHEAEDAASDKCRKWLDENYPDHGDPVKSWDY